MNDLSLSVYVKRWIIVFIINKLILIDNVLLKRDDMCLMPLSNFVTISRFDEGKQIRIVLEIQCLILWQRCNNVVSTSWQRWRATLWQRRRLTSAQFSFSTVPQRCDNVNNDLVTTLWQRQQRRCDNVVTTSLFQLGYDKIGVTWGSWGHEQ